MGWCEKEIPLLHPSMTSLPMAISQETQPPPSAAYLFHPVHIFENRHKPGWLLWTPFHIIIPARNAAKASPQELRGHMWQEAEYFRAGWWVPEMSFEPSALGASTEQHDFTAVGQNKETTKITYLVNFSKTFFLIELLDRCIMYCGCPTYINTSENKAFCISNDSTDAGSVLTIEKSIFKC